jgi:exodeoxyribonuclease VII large subunit
VKEKFNQLDLFQSLQNELGGAATSKPQIQKALSVSVLTEQIKGNLEENFSNVYVEGEISNFSKPSSGHIYATLKDKNAQISIVIFRSAVSKIRFQMKDGLEVIVKGQVTVYNQRGSYQIIVQSVEPKGVGSLQLAFEQLKQKLLEEGLFDVVRKRPLPFMPQKIGVVTSLTGAAIKDFITGVKNRCPIVDIILIPVKVQGENSALEIAAAIQRFNHLNNVDVIVVGRGGGSMEDLWSFNEEIVARSIFHSRIPVISAVGHEIDVSISDFVADAKAMTPTHAAILCVPDLEELKKTIFDHHQKIKNNFLSVFKSSKLKIKNYERVFTIESFERRFRNKQLHCDKLEMRLKDALKSTFNHYDGRFSIAKTKFNGLQPQFLKRLIDNRKSLVFQEQLLISKLNALILNKRKKLEYSARSLGLLSPLKTIDRGYSIAKSLKTDKLLRTIDKVAVGDQIVNMISDGNIYSTVVRLENKENPIE